MPRAGFAGNTRAANHAIAHNAPAPGTRARARCRAPTGTFPEPDGPVRTARVLSRGALLMCPAAGLGRGWGAWTAVSVTVGVMGTTAGHIGKRRGGAGAARPPARLASLRPRDRGGVPATACRAAPEDHRAWQQLRRGRCRGSPRAAGRAATRLWRPKCLLVLGTAPSIGQRRGRRRFSAARHLPRYAAHCGSRPT
jgi:hypothetical protein